MHVNSKCDHTLSLSLSLSLSSLQADAGGLVSPGGISYIGRSKEILGEIPGAVAIKRMDLDEALAREAQRYVVVVVLYCSIAQSST